VEINRNQYFMAGLLVLFLGIQFRFVDSYVLTEQTTRFLAERSGKPIAAGATQVSQLFPAAGPPIRKVVHPPDWIGWALISFGSVLILHSLAMKRPDG
jgi:hypothetical protein